VGVQVGWGVSEVQVAFVTSLTLPSKFVPLSHVERLSIDFR